MRKSESFWFVILGSIGALGLVVHLFYEEALKAALLRALSKSLGRPETELMERLADMSGSLLMATAIVWFIYRYLKRQFNNELQEHRSRRLEMTLYIVPRAALGGKVLHYWLRIHNSSIAVSAMNVVVSPDPSLIVENTILPAWGHALERRIDRIDPNSNWDVELFGLSEDFHGSDDQRDVFHRPHEFIIRVSAVDTPETAGVFEFDATKWPVVRQLPAPLRPRGVMA